MVTHPLLDCFTAYGTQFFWPLSRTPIAWSTVFDIDPIYTVPLLIGVTSSLLFFQGTKNRGHKLNNLGLTLSTAYLAWSISAKIFVMNFIESELHDQNVKYSQMLVMPTPFNTILWRILLIDETGYYEGFYSMLEERKRTQLKHYQSNENLLRGITNHWPVKRLQWFTKGFYAVQRQGLDIVITDLRMGLEPFYLFWFAVGEIGNPHAKPIKPVQVRREWNLAPLASAWQRIW